MRKSRAAGRRLTLGSLLFGVMVLGAGVASAPIASAAGTINCNNGGDLQHALDVAASGATILVFGTCEGDFTVTGKNITVRGNPNATLDGMGAGRTFTMESPNVLHLTNLTVTGGVSQFAGGVGATGDVFLTNVTLSGNETSSSSAIGGGLLSFGNVTATSSRILNNRASAAGDGSGSGVSALGGGLVSFGNMTVTGSTVQGNVATATNTSGTAGSALAESGGLAADGTTLTISKSKIIGNRVGASGVDPEAVGAGAWIASGTGTLSLVKSVVSGNLSGATAVSGSPLAGWPVFTGQFPSGSSGGPLNISGSKILGNRSFANGDSATAVPGVASLHSSLTLTNSVIQGNLGWATGPTGVSAEYTAARADSTLTVTGSKIVGNKGWATSTNGDSVAAIAVDASTINMSKSTFDGNTFTSKSANGDSTAGIAILASTLTLTKSTVSRNASTATTTTANTATAIVGGALGGVATISNSTVALNTLKATSPSGGSSTGIAGGMLIGNSNPSTVTESTVAANKITVGGGGTLTSIAGGLLAGNMTTLRDTIVAKNVATTGPDCYTGITSGDYNLIGKTAGCGWTNAGHDKLNKNPLLGPLANYGGPTLTMLPAKTSPAVNAVPNAACPIKSDQRGVHRPQQVKCEIGSDERTSTDPAVHPISSSSRSSASATRSSTSSTTRVDASAQVSRLVGSIQSRIAGLLNRSGGPSFDRLARAALARGLGRT